MRDGDFEGGQAARAVFAYHEASKHRLDGYAPGPAQVNWDHQPSPYRQFSGAPRLALPLAAHSYSARFAELYAPRFEAPAPMEMSNIALLLELSLGLSAWKVMGTDRWALRCTPSSGNLHPLEAYVLAGGLPGLEDGLYHYAPESHALEARARGDMSGPGLWLGLSSIAWRETWKYGLRAFRYTALDTGHAMGAIRFAAASLGWSVQRVVSLADHDLAALLGLSRAADFAGAEREAPELLLHLQPGRAREAAAPDLVANEWFGQASQCDPRGAQTWPGMAEITEACRAPAQSLRAGQGEASLEIPPKNPGQLAAPVILGRRSARRFTSRQPIALADFTALMAAAMPGAASPQALLPQGSKTHLICFVHKVEGLEQGLYLLPRADADLEALRTALDPGFTWRELALPGGQLRLYQLAGGNFRPVIRKFSCHQAIAGECGVSIAMLGAFDAPIAQAPWSYRALHWEAGLIGQSLYLCAQQAGLAGSGIGCFFDDEMHALLGLSSRRFQVLYHFALGYPREDGITTEPAYGRPEPERGI
ncbi:MAG: SagB/ThcOx family dehydrogenase [Mangrovicoccus sp.]|nr:SagB/ThcOx family dehydrogenase [Mangrovicoccus sp.]